MIIIDCGMSWKYLCGQFAKHQIDYKTADALFITHLHGDHCAQIKKFGFLPKYVTFEMADAGQLDFYQPLKIKDLVITPLPLSHDSPGTAGYLISRGKEKLVYITDTGYLSERNRSLLKNADYYIIESNHDEVMLLSTNRPNMLKRRIILDDGHLSNGACAIILTELIGPKTKEIVLAHLSQEANKPELALAKLQEIFQENGIAYSDLRIQVASQTDSIKGGNL